MSSSYSLFEHFFILQYERKEQNLIYFKSLATGTTLSNENVEESSTNNNEIVEEFIPFCFPEGSTITNNSNDSQSDAFTFAFVLTNSDGSKRFGFCRRMSSIRCICFITLYPFFQFFDKLCSVVESQQKMPNSIPLSTLDSLVETLSELDFNNTLQATLPSQPLANLLSPDAMTIRVQLPLQLASQSFVATVAVGPSLLGDVAVDSLVSSLKGKNILQVLGSVIAERRIIFTSSNLRKLSYSTLAFASLLYPLSWQYIFIPILPQSCLSYCCAPMPFIVGVHYSHLSELETMPLEDEIVFIDLDSNTVAGAIPADLELIPTSAVAKLQKSLKKLSKNTMSSGGLDSVGVRASFLAFWLEVLGVSNYNQHNRPSIDDLRSDSFFNPDSQRLIASLRNTQMFEQFIQQWAEGSEDLKPFFLSLENRHEFTPQRQQLQHQESRGDLEETRIVASWKSFLKKADQSRKEVGAAIRELMNDKPMSRENSKSLLPPAPPPSISRGSSTTSIPYLSPQSSSSSFISTTSSNNTNNNNNGGGSYIQSNSSSFISSSPKSPPQQSFQSQSQSQSNNTHNAPIANNSQWMKILSEMNSAQSNKAAQHLFSRRDAEEFNRRMTVVVPQGQFRPLPLPPAPKSSVGTDGTPPQFSHQQRRVKPRPPQKPLPPPPPSSNNRSSQLPPTPNNNNNNNNSNGNSEKIVVSPRQLPEISKQQQQQHHQNHDEPTYAQVVIRGMIPNSNSNSTTTSTTSTTSPQTTTSTTQTTNNRQTIQRPLPNPNANSSIPTIPPRSSQQQQQPPQRPRNQTNVHPNGTASLRPLPNPNKQPQQHQQQHHHLITHSSKLISAEKHHSNNNNHNNNNHNNNNNNHHLSPNNNNSTKHQRRSSHSDASSIIITKTPPQIDFNPSTKNSKHLSGSLQAVHVDKLVNFFEKEAPPPAK